MITAFPYVTKVGLAVGVCDGRSKPLPYPNIVCFGNRGEIGCYRQDGGSKPPPYRDLFVSVIEVRLAVTVLNGASGTSPPTAICLFQ